VSRRRRDGSRGAALPPARGLEVVRLRAALRLGFGGAAVDAQGVYLRGPDREQYLDAASGAEVPLGYAHPAVVAAARAALDARAAGSPLLADRSRLAVGERIAGLAPSGLAFLGLYGSGRAALEAARTLVHALTGRDPAVVEPLPPESFDVEAAGRAAALAAEAGAPLLVDERGIGPGRLGALVGAEALRLAPDLVVVGGLGGGLAPACCLLAASNMVSAIESRTEAAGPLGEVVGLGAGDGFPGPVACAAARATLDALADGEITRRAVRVGAEFGAALAALAEDEADTIADVRGAGLAWAIECVAPEIAERLVRRLAVDRILVVPLAPGERVIRLLPPLVIEKRQLDFVASSIAQAVEEA
jgi:4-aminobutyrate aminotransferase-like enzyme